MTARADPKFTAAIQAAVSTSWTTASWQKILDNWGVKDAADHRRTNPAVKE